MEPQEAEGGPASYAARVLAPLALVAVALIVIAVVSGSLDGSEDGNNDRPDGTRAETPGCAPTDEGRMDLENGYFVLESGENLTTVSEETCVSPEQLIRLNPNLDPQLLPVSACVDLITDGCKKLAAG